MQITQAIYDKLAGDPTLTGMLQTFNGGPAIFTSWPVPPEARRPFVITSGSVSEIPVDELSAYIGTEYLRDVNVYFDNDGSALQVEAAIARVRAILHRQPLNIAGGRHLLTQAVNGGVAPTDETLVGRFATFRIIAMEA